MKVTIHGYALPETSDVQYRLCEVFLDMDLPFIPAAGTNMKVAIEGGCFTVDLVEWDFTRPEKINVLMCEPSSDEYESLRPISQMLAQGWRKELELR